MVSLSLLLQCLLSFLVPESSSGWSRSPQTSEFDMDRRQWLATVSATATLVGSDTAVMAATPVPVHSTDVTESAVSLPAPFRSAGFERSEYTNSIIASRDTNISPKEVYDTLLSLRPLRQRSSSATTLATGTLRALDVGAGAGVSTQVLYELGYTTIDACDWSDDAWNLNVVERGHCPSSVHFYQLDDERFFRQWKANPSYSKYDAIVFNFAINRDKALLFATELLVTDGILLAPVNTQQDYWLTQSYVLYNAKGETLWTASDVGAWSVLFQPDVTQSTCQGIWCAPYNGFQKQQ